MWGAVGSTAAPDPPTKGCAGRLPAEARPVRPDRRFHRPWMPANTPTSADSTPHPKAHPSPSPNAAKPSPTPSETSTSANTTRAPSTGSPTTSPTKPHAPSSVLVERARNAAILKSWAEAKTYNPAPAVGRAQVPDDDEPIQPWLEGESAFGIPNPYIHGNSGPGYDQ
jgi:hypothetical protein